LSELKSNTPRHLITANLHKRFLAMIYDGILVFSLVFCAAMLFTAISIFIAPTENTALLNSTTDSIAHDVEQIKLSWLIWPYCFGIGLSFYIYFWRAKGQTLGMRAWKLSIQHHEKGPLSIGQCLIRCLAAIVSLAFLGLGYWYALIDKNGDTLHDKLSRTWIGIENNS